MQTRSTLSPPSRAAWIEIRSINNPKMPIPSPPSRAAWIEMALAVSEAGALQSPPSRAAWIEICWSRSAASTCWSRRLHGRRGLKFNEVCSCNRCWLCRRLHGRRGLKYIIIKKIVTPSGSPPSRAAWIEMPLSVSEPYQGCGSPPSRAAWIEIPAECFLLYLN